MLTQTTQFFWEIEDTWYKYSHAVISDSCRKPQSRLQSFYVTKHQTIGTDIGWGHTWDFTVVKGVYYG